MTGRENRGEILVAAEEIRIMSMLIKTCAKLNQALDEIPGTVQGIRECLDRIEKHYGVLSESSREVSG